MAVATTGRNRSSAASQDRVGTCCRFPWLKSLDVPDQHDPVAHGQTQYRGDPEERAERKHAAAEIRRNESAECRYRHADDDEARQTPAPQRGLQQQDDHDRGRNQIAVQRPQRSLSLDMLAEHFGMILERERAFLDALLDLVRSRQPGSVR